MKILLNLVRKNRGFALLLVLVFTSIGLLLMSASMSYTSNSALLNERNNQYNSTMLAAEAATEKIVSAMINDFKNYGQPGIANNLNNYKLLVPTSTENAYWSSFQFTDAQGNANRSYVVANGASYFTADLGSTYSGLGGTRIPYKIISNAKMANGRFTLTNAVQQEVAFTTIPIFQYAIFYNGLLELTRAAPLNIRGRVHSNSSIYYGSFSSSYVNFYEDVTSSGTMEKKTWWDYTVSDYTGAITFHQSKTTNAPTMSLPIGTNNTSAAVHEVIERPDPGEAINSAMGQERYYNKAEVVILVSNNTVNVSIKTPNSATSNAVLYTNAQYFISTNKNMYDQREGENQRITEIDMAKFKTWLGTNTTVSSTLSTTPSIVYIEDTRGGIVYTTNITTTPTVTTVTTWPGNGVGPVTTNAGAWQPSGTGVAFSSLPAGYYQYYKSSSGPSRYKYNYIASYTYNDSSNLITNINVTSADTGNAAVRLVNGKTLPANGMTIVTPNGLYVQGHYNCPTDAHLGTTNTADTKPASLVADAVTLLSGSWNDANSNADYTTRDAANTTVNAAILSGNVESQGSDGDSPMSGGAHNLPRLLEDWTSRTLTINGSLVCLYQSTRANGNFIHPGYSGQYYVPPTRDWSFDRNFLDPNKLPPGTPAVRVLERLKWTNPPANTVNYAGY
ncbi:MAG: hypothetical protein ACO1QS_10115 [Verrucomicrobiota bacterium]